MRTAVISDLHLGSVSGADLARDPEVQDVLLGELESAERLVLLGDVIELRERPLAEALELAVPFLGRVGDALAEKPVILVPGNHDHRLAGPLLEGLALGKPRQLDWEHTVRARGPGAAAAEALRPARAEIRYPGVWLGD